MLDLLAAELPLDIAEITRLQRMKTGAIIAFSCDAGAILGKAAEAARHALHAYAHDLGLAFQIVDDLLDAEGSDADVGKRTPRTRRPARRPSFRVLGVERAREQADMLAAAGRRAS